jgi:vancomycin resistance protein YoaR
MVAHWFCWLMVFFCVAFGVDARQVKEYLEGNISKYINQQPIDAKFKAEGDKVTEFQGSRVGLSIDYSTTAQHINEVLLARAQGNSVSSTLIAVNVVQPQVTVADVNNLGITDIVGVGFTTFHDSHTNRIKNIARAVTLLNGTLIKPGETFSTLDHTAPFTTANGYLPELVIKGNKIEPELGGGLCQISTTLFRTAMNTALPIAERHPHGLVVNYYADPVNGNPGVDASVYEGSLDFKFTNDTGNYLLLQTDIDYTKQQLTFTIWGKPDGRKGSYTHPAVTQRIGVGAPQELPDPTLAVGKKVCQNAFSGAVANFTYTRILPTGEKIDRVFESHYRAVPQTCRVGVDSSTTDSLASLIDSEPVVDTLAPVN